MDLELGGKAFIVTGGTDGLGIATVRILLAEGANVLVSRPVRGRVRRSASVAG